jgi:hypothetical protein
MLAAFSFAPISTTATKQASCSSTDQGGGKAAVGHQSSSASRFAARAADNQKSSLGQLVEKAINGGNPAVPGDDEISPGVRWRMTRVTRHPIGPARHCPTPRTGRLADIGSQDDRP